MTPAAWNISTTGIPVLATNKRIASVASLVEAFIPSKRTGSWAFSIFSTKSLTCLGSAIPKTGSLSLFIDFTEVFSFMTSAGRDTNVAPFLGSLAFLKALVIASEILSWWPTSTADLVTGRSKLTLSMLWCVCFNKSERLTWPPIATTGSPSEFAVISPVARLLTPGPEVTKATPGFPVRRPTACAIKAAFCSWRTTISSGPRSTSASKTASIFAPGMAKTCLTPSFIKVSTTNSAPRRELLSKLSLIIIPPTLWESKNIY